MGPDIPVLYEDTEVLVVDKPSGIVVNRALSVKGETVQDWAEHRLQAAGYQFTTTTELETLFKDRSGTVHRLDKETSGILLIAKNPTALQNLLAQFKNREVKKEYTALAHGAIAPKEATINAPIGRLTWRRGLFGVMPGGKHAVTHYTVTDVYKRGKEQYSLLRVKIETGRTHQIRVHLQYIGHPVVGDAFYAGRKTTRKARTWCPRLFLHASFIRFKQPLTGEKITITSPIEGQLQQVLELLEKV